MEEQLIQLRQLGYGIYRPFANGEAEYGGIIVLTPENKAYEFPNYGCLQKFLDAYFED